jgi:hypothetical protein
MNSRVWTPRRSAVHTLIKITSQHRSNRNPLQGSPPVNKFGILATPSTRRWKADCFRSSQPSFLEFTAKEDLIESEVLVLGNVPQIRVSVSFTVREELSGGFDFVA